MNSALPTPPEGYADWLVGLKAEIAHRRQRAALAVNAELIGLYARIGRDILERQQRLGWGAKVIDRLSVDLAKAFPDMVKASQASYAGQLKEWEEQYPANHMLFVKHRLQKFLEETKEIYFNAELTLKGGKKVFVNPKYEGKNRRWKMAYRAGKEVVEPAREFVQLWITEIK